jgi:phospho-N-acetylmuramoyl-pentapeptide-transferase
MLYILFWVNAVNITDGLDGLACGCYLITFGGILLATTLIAQIKTEMVIPSAALLGGCLGFLRYNKYPAKIFMGDIGSLSLGAYFGVFLCVNGLELVGLIAGGVFLIEFLSSLLQIVYFKITGKRLLLIAPLHHHFQFKDIPEPKITIRFWLGSIGFGILATLLYLK